MMAALLKETSPLEVKDGDLIVEIAGGFTFHREKLEELETRQLIEDILEDLSGTRYRIQFITGQSSASTEVVIDDQEPRPAKSKPGVVKDPMIGKAVEIFKATVVSVKDS